MSPGSRAARQTLRDDVAEADALARLRTLFSDIMDSQDEYRWPACIIVLTPGAGSSRVAAKVSKAVRG